MFWVSLTAYAVMTVVVITAAYTDARDGKVYNWLTFPAVFFAMAFWAAVAAYTGQTEPLARCGIGLAAGLLPYACLVLLGGLGGGDMKLMAAIGALSASWKVVLATTVYALLLALLLALALMIRHRLVKYTLLRLFTGQIGKPNPNLTQPTVPFAVTAALGALVAGAEFLLGWNSPWGWIGP